MSQVLSNVEYIVDGQFSQECVELKVRHREEDILHRLGILHLENKVTRPRYTSDESEASILKQAGLYYFNTEEYRNSALEERMENKNKNTTVERLTRKEVEILRNAGVTWLDNMAIVHDDDTYSHKLLGSDSKSTSNTAMGAIGHKLLGCDSVHTCTTAMSIIEESTVNSTYAERELLRRLKHGWFSTGDKCDECDMPIICKSKGNLLECVICGVVGEDNYNPDLEDSYNRDGENIGVCNENGPVGKDIGVYNENGHNAVERPGVLDVHTNASTITPSLGPNERFDIEPGHDGGCLLGGGDGRLLGKSKGRLLDRVNGCFLGVGDGRLLSEGNGCSLGKGVGSLLGEGDGYIEPGHEMYHSREHQTALVENAQLNTDQPIHCDSQIEKEFHLTSCGMKAHVDDDESYKEELGLRLFNGWELTKLNCPSCNRPLISEGEGASAICLRCGSP